MKRTHLIATVLGAILVFEAGAQPKPPPGEHEALPVDLVLADLAAAYSRTFAESVNLRFKAPGAPERKDTVTIRVQAGAEPGSGPLKAILELGTLRVLATRERLVAIGTSIPTRYYEHASVDGSVTATIAAVLPPVPLPQLALVAGGGDRFADPTPYTGSVNWNSATADMTVRPAIVTLMGAGQYGPVAITLSTEPVRLRTLSATLRTRDGEGSLDLTFSSLDPGDPAAWVVNTDGRERVPSLAQLRPPASKPALELKPGDLVPDLSFSRPNLGSWSLHNSLGGVPDGALSNPALVLIFRSLPDTDRSAAIALDAQAGCKAVRSMQGGSVPAAAGTVPATAAAVVIELGEFKAERLEEARQKWAGQAESGAALRPMDELLWSSGAAQSIDRFAPGAGAVLIVIGPDRRLRRSIKLDGRSGDAEAITAELAAALADPANAKEAPSPEPPR